MKKGFNDISSRCFFLKRPLSSAASARGWIRDVWLIVWAKMKMEMLSGAMANRSQAALKGGRGSEEISLKQYGEEELEMKHGHRADILLREFGDG